MGAYYLEGKGVGCVIEKEDGHSNGPRLLIARQLASSHFIRAAETAQANSLKHHSPDSLPGGHSSSAKK